METKPPIHETDMSTGAAARTTQHTFAASIDGCCGVEPWLQRSPVIGSKLTPGEHAALVYRTAAAITAKVKEVANFIASPLSKQLLRGRAE